MAAADLVAEIRSDAGRGSGFLIGPNLVLTALHVLLGDNPPGVPDQVRAEIRLRQDVDAFDQEAGYDYRSDRYLRRIAAQDARLEWHGARMIYPLPGTDRLPDIALLRIDAAAGDFPGLATPPTAIRLSRRPMCRATGFPIFAAKEVGGKTIWERYPLGGEITDPGRGRDGSIAIAVKSPTPDTADGWKGLSGAALWRDDEEDFDEEGLPTFARLFGVVNARADNAHGNALVSYWPLSDLADDDPFWTLAGMQPTGSAPRPLATAAVVAMLRDGMNRIDRQPPEDRFLAWLRGDSAMAATPTFGRTGPPTKPMAMVMRSHAVDEGTLYVTRLASILGQLDLHKHGANYRKPILLGCGQEEDDAETPAFGFMRRLAEQYLDRDPDLTDDLDAIVAAGLRAPDRSRLIVIEHDDTMVGPNCRATLDLILSRIAALAAADMPSPPMLVLSFFTGSVGGTEAEGFLPPVAYPGKDAAIVDVVKGLMTTHPAFDWHDQRLPLGDPNPKSEDIVRWIDQMSRQRGCDVPAPLRNKLQAALENQPVFSMRFARQRLDRVLAG